jgi:hypothetical protein
VFEDDIVLLLKEVDALADHLGLTKGDPQNLCINPIGIHGVFYSDRLIPESLHSLLTIQAEPLETYARSHNQWHPNSDEQVLDLVHPSNYCLVFGRTGYSLNPDAIFPEHTFLFESDDSSDGVSSKYQWLPSTVHVNDAGQAAFKSRINNLDQQQYPEMYNTIAKVFELMLPLFEKAMGSLDVEPKRRIDAPFRNSDFQQDKEEHMEECLIDYIKDLKVFGELDERQEKMSDDELKEELRYDFFDDHYDDDRDVYQPQFPDLETVDFLKDFITDFPPYNLRGRNLQVIVKMANIHLTPDNPEYDGGSWHVEGMDNEAIVATGIYYYDMDNITTSTLTFRHEYSPHIFEYEQSDFKGLEVVYDFENESYAAQELGGIKAVQGRCVVFPNFFHHLVNND